MSSAYNLVRRKTKSANMTQDQFVPQSIYQIWQIKLECCLIFICDTNVTVQYLDLIIVLYYKHVTKLYVFLILSPLIK